VKKLTAYSLASILLLVLLGFLLIPARVDSGDIDLKLGGEGANSWNVDNIYPGQSGSQTVTLYNASNRDGLVTIWITDIEETDFAGDGAWLAYYVVFELASDRLSTNLSWPLKIYDFPQNASGKPNYLRIDPIGARETVTLIWHWHFLPEAGNEAQGDSFSFTINYKLERVLPPVPPPEPEPEPPPPPEPEPEPEPPPPPEPEPPIPPEPPVPPPPSPPPTPPVPPVEEIKLPFMPWIAGGALVIAAVIYLAIKRRRR